MLNSTGRFGIVQRELQDSNRGILHPRMSRHGALLALLCGETNLPVMAGVQGLTGVDRCRGGGGCGGGVAGVGGGGGNAGHGGLDQAAVAAAGQGRGSALDSDHTRSVVIIEKYIMQMHQIWYRYRFWYQVPVPGFLFS